MAHLIDVYHITVNAGPGGIGRPVGVKATVDGVAGTFSPDEWSTLCNDPNNTYATSEKEGAWPPGTQFP